MRTRYLYVCPRGFANETGIYRITNQEQLRAAQRLIDRDDIVDAHFVSASSAQAHLRANRATARSQGAAGLSLQSNPVGARNITPGDELLY